MPVGAWLERLNIDVGASKYRVPDIHAAEVGDIGRLP